MGLLMHRALPLLDHDEVACSADGNTQVDVSTPGFTATGDHVVGEHGGKGARIGGIEAHRHHRQLDLGSGFKGIVRDVEGLHALHYLTTVAIWLRDLVLGVPPTR